MKCVAIVFVSVNAEEDTSSLLQGLRHHVQVEASPTSDLYLLPQKYADIGGRCMDGTMSGFYYAAPAEESDLWVIKLDGGGSCNSEVSCRDWAAKDGGRKGGSAKWPSTKVPNARESVLSDDASINPDFYEAHKVRVPYCTADSHSGTITEPGDAQWGYYFSGHLNFEFIVQHMFDSIPAMKQAQRILLTGSSAGGSGTIHNCDFLQEKLSDLGVPAQVSCSPEAGWFTPGYTDDQEDPELPPSTYARWSAGQTGGGEDSAGGTFNLFNSYVHPECANAHSPQDAYKCTSATVVYPFVRAPMYVVQNTWDYVQLLNIFGVPRIDDPLVRQYVAYYGRAMRSSTQTLKSGDGIFLPSCVGHGEGLGVTPKEGSTVLNGYTSMQGLGDWFFGRKTVPSVLVEDCDLPCNTQCAGP